MRKRYTAFLLLVFSCSLLGKEIRQNPPKCRPTHTANNEKEKSSYLLIGGNYSHVDIEPSENSSLHGNLGGINTLYEYQPRNNLYAGLFFHWRQGNTSGSNGTVFLTDFNMAERFGYTWGENRWMTTLFTGFGLRILNHHQKFQDGFASSSVKIDYYEFYFPVGGKAAYAFASWFTLGMNLTWMAQAFPSAQIRPFGGAYWELSHTFANFLVELPLTFRWLSNPSFLLAIAPFYERWEDGHSTAATSTGIPLGLQKNSYNFIGVNLNIIYSF